MTTGMPELGSKISLISKADIRYEGRLFTVDPQECTIALASVRSFGTEDRETQYPVPAQNQVYDYILFRGSDIKDIRVVNNVPHHPQPLNDPAIMQLSVPPSLGSQQFQSHPVLGNIGPHQFGSTGGAPTGGGGAYGGMSAIGGLTNNLPAAGGMVGAPPGGGGMQGIIGVGGAHKSELLIGPPDQPSPLLATNTDSVNRHELHDLIGGGAGGSRCTTPANSLGSRKSPTNDQGVQAGGSKRHDDKRTVRPIQPPNGGHHNRNQNQHHQRRSSNSRERRDSRGDGQHKNQNRQQMNRHQGYHQGGYQQQNNRGGNGGGWVNRGPMRQRGRSRGGAGFKPNNQNQASGGGNKKNTLKFENDFDFEQANTEFEELRSQLSKTKIEDGGGGSNAATDKPSTGIKTGEVNGDADSKKDDSGNETGAGETEQEEEHEVFYDKSKSFFDKISCEAVERAKGKSQRTDWRTERKLNSETFGVAATRRGNYRGGRGGYRGMGGGGYRGNYRGNNSYNRPNQRHYNNQHQRSNNAQSSNSTAADDKNDNSNQKSSGSATAKQVAASSAPEPAMAVK